MAAVVLTKEWSLADQFLTEVRDKRIQQDRRRFRENLELLGSIMAYEISRKIEYRVVETETVMGLARGRVMKKSPVLITLLRAGIPFYAGFQKFYGQSDAGFVGIQRVEGGNSITIKMDYAATPRLEGRDVILVDPMLATGKSATDSIAEILRNGTPQHIHIASLIATQPGIRQIEEHVRIAHTIWTFAIDEQLNDKFYIVPGLGDAGDLSFGEKV
jgi:uracil phosphoribosyltransferase